MMLRVSKMADYATIILNCLSANTGRLLSATDIAKKISLARPTVSKILKALLEAGIVVSTRGAVGGYALARSADQITIAQVIAAIEGQLALTECSRATLICTQEAVCSVKHNWQIIHQFIMNTLQNITLADMLKPISLPISHANAKN